MVTRSVKKYVLSISIGLLLTFACLHNVRANDLRSLDFVSEKQSFEFSVLSDTEQAKKMANMVVDKLVAEDFDGIVKNFSEAMKQAVTAQQIEEVWDGAKAKEGNYKSRSTPETQERDNHYGAYIICQMEKGKVGIEVWVDGSGKIAGLWIKPA